MNLLVSSLLELTSTDGQHEEVRVVDLNPAGDRVYLVRTDLPHVLPEPRKLSEIQAGLVDGTIKFLTDDPFAALQRPDDTIPEKHRIRRDRAWKRIASIVTAPNAAALRPRSRARLIRKAIKGKISLKKYIYRDLSRYFQGGMTRNALLPHFHRCGAPGKERRAGAKKRGRPRRLTEFQDAPPGINITSEDAEKLRKGYKRYHLNRSEDGHRSLRSAYVLTMREYFSAGRESRGGVDVEALPPAHLLPTFAQFRYWGRKDENPEESAIRRYGERKFNLKKRPVLGDSTKMAQGPGSLFEIDSTVGDVWIVSGLDRSRRLGKPTVYIVRDVFSHAIAGCHVGLENPSFFAAGLALENAIANKVEYCARFGITISSEDWPCQGLPEAILADRGELKGHGASNIVASLGIKVCNTPPYRPDSKGLVEREFRTLNDLLNHSLPGAVRGPKERGERDPRLEAVLTLNEYRSLLIHSILFENKKRIDGYRPDPDMIADQVEPRPADIWEWGIVNRSGHLRAMDPQIVRSNLLPSGKASVTYRGIKFRTLFYSNERALREGWLVKARSSGSSQIDVVFDPRRVDTILIRIPRGEGLELCRLVDADRRFTGMTWEEVDDFAFSQSQAREVSRTADLQSQIDHQAQVDAIVSHAVDEAANANRGFTKAQRLRGVRENRKTERQRDWVQETREPEVSVPPEGKNGNGAHCAPLEPQAANDYVPPPSLLEMLRRQREARWRKDE